MTQARRPNSGVLFVNDRRETENHPHYNGQCEIESVSLWVNGWIKAPKNGGNEFISLAFREKDAPKDTPRPEDRNLSGALFVNERKDTDAKPDYTGKCTVGGVEYYLNAWIRAPREAGDDFISFEVEKSGVRSTGRLDAKAMLAQTKSRGFGHKPAEQFDDFEDKDIPF